MTTQQQIFAELDQMNFLTDYPDHKDTGLNIHQIDKLIESFTEKYGFNDDIVKFYEKKRKEILNKIIEKIKN